VREAPAAAPDPKGTDAKPPAKGAVKVAAGDIWSLYSSKFFLRNRTYFVDILTTIRYGFRTKPMEAYMESTSLESDILKVMEDVLSAALREVRKARSRRSLRYPNRTTDSPNTTRMSQTNACIDILKQARHPMHISALLDTLNARGIKASRESLVSAICKKLTPNGPFVRTAPNTFDLANNNIQKKD